MRSVPAGRKWREVLNLGSSVSEVLSLSNSMRGFLILSSPVRDILNFSSPMWEVLIFKQSRQGGLGSNIGGDFFLLCYRTERDCCIEQGLCHDQY